MGSSESGGIAWRKRSVEADGRITGTGYRPLPATQFRIENSLLVIKSPQLSTDDWETTADMVSLNADGDTFTLLGRADRIVKIEGKRVSLKTVENALLATGLVSEVKAFSRKTNAQSTVERIAVAAVTTPETDSIENLFPMRCLGYAGGRIFTSSESSSTRLPMKKLFFTTDP